MGSTGTWKARGETGRSSIKEPDGRWGRLAVTRKASGDIDWSTKEVEGRWEDEQQHQHGRQEEILAGVSMRPREGGRLAVTWKAI